MSVHYVCSPAMTLGNSNNFCGSPHMQQTVTLKLASSPTSGKALSVVWCCANAKEGNQSTTSRFPELAQHRVDGVECRVNLFSNLYKEMVVSAKDPARRCKQKNQNIKRLLLHQSKLSSPKQRSTGRPSV
jgi:hypothetical protein